MIPTEYPLALLDFLGGGELLLIFLLVLIFFGGEKMPEVARGLAKAMREFKKAASGVEEEFKRAMEEEPKRPASAPPPATVPANLTSVPSILPPRPPGAEALPAADSDRTPGIGAAAVGLAPAAPPPTADPPSDPAPRTSAPAVEPSGTQGQPNGEKQIHPDHPSEDAG